MPFPAAVLEFRQRRTALARQIESWSNMVYDVSCSRDMKKKFRLDLQDIKKEVASFDTRYAQKSPEFFCSCFPKKAELIVARLTDIDNELNKFLLGSHLMAFREILAMLSGKLGGLCNLQWHDDMPARARHFQMLEWQYLIDRANGRGSYKGLGLEMTSKIFKFNHSLRYWGCSCPDSCGKPDSIW